MKKNGFTLVEMLVVIAVLSVFGTLILVIFTRTLRGGGKTQIITAIKQNGQSVLEVLDKTIRNADLVACLSPTGSTLVVEQKGIYTRYRFVPPNNTIPAIGNCGSINGSSNGCFIQDNPDTPVKRILNGREYPDKDFINKVCADNDPMLPEAATLTDTNTQTGVSVDCVASNCTLNPFFLRGTAVGYKDQVTIKFDLKPAVDASKVVGQIDPVTFQTTVQLR